MPGYDSWKTRSPDDGQYDPILDDAPPNEEKIDAANVREHCDWPTGQFSFADSLGAHDPCFVVMPGGGMIPLNHHAADGVDIARAKFIIDACNEKLAREHD